MNREYEQNNHESGLFETTFGVDGEVETYTNEKAVRFFVCSERFALISLFLSLYTYTCLYFGSNVFFIFDWLKQLTQRWVKAKNLLAVNIITEVAKFRFSCALNMCCSSYICVLLIVMVHLLYISKMKMLFLETGSVPSFDEFST